MAFKPIYSCPESGDVTYRTPVRKDSQHGVELMLRFKAELLKKAAIKPGDRCMIEVDAEEGLGRIYNNSQIGWLIKPPTLRKKAYTMRLAWKPESGFAKSESNRNLEVLQSGNGEIIFKMPQEGGAQ